MGNQVMPSGGRFLGCYTGTLSQLSSHSNPLQDLLLPDLEMPWNGGMPYMFSFTKWFILKRIGFVSIFWHWVFREEFFSQQRQQ